MTYASMAGIIRPLSKRGEKTGSLTHLDLSQRKKRAPVTKARTSVDTTVALFQGYFVPPLSSAKTMRMEDARRRITPTKSTLLRVDELTLLRSNAIRLCFGLSSLGLVLEFGRSHTKRTIARPPAGPLKHSRKIILRWLVPGTCKSCTVIWG